MNSNTQTNFKKDIKINGIGDMITKKKNNNMVMLVIIIVNIGIGEYITKMVNIVIFV